MSEPLSPAAMAAVATTPRFMSPRAVSHFGLAAMEARAARTRAASQPPPRPGSLGPFPQMPPGPQSGQAPPSLVPPGPAGPAATRPRRVVIRLWLPLTALFLLLAPFALLLTPLIWLCTPPRYRTRPLASVIGLGRVLLSLGGTVVHVDTPEALVSIRIF